MKIAMGRATIVAQTQKHGKQSHGIGSAAERHYHGSIASQQPPRSDKVGRTPLEIAQEHPIRHFYDSFSSSASHKADDASDGMRQSPRGERHTLPTLGPSGRHERLNC